LLAVLLERRVLLRSSCYRLLTQAGEGLRTLLYPLRLLHTYIPVLPWVLADYVEVGVEVGMAGSAEQRIVGGYSSHHS
jgi:hypothetical protein